MNIFGNTYSKLKNNFSTILEELYQTNIHDIITVYIKIICYKILPYLLFFSILNHTNIYFKSIKYIFFIYSLINLFITDFILRQSIKYTKITNIKHSCSKCPVNLIHNIEECISIFIFNLVGYMISKHNILLDIYWRSYLHTNPLMIKEKVCIRNYITFNYVGIPFGIINYCFEQIVSTILPTEYVFFLMMLLNFYIDSIIYISNIQYSNNKILNILLEIIWFISECFTLGIIEFQKRKIKTNDIIKDTIFYFNYLKNHNYYKVILWSDFQQLNNFISTSYGSVYYREHISNIYHLLYNILNNIKNNKTIKFIRKSKIIHLTSLFSNLFPTDYKIYLKIFDSRKYLEPFLFELVRLLEHNLTNYKLNSENIPLENKNINIKLNIIDKYMN